MTPHTTISSTSNQTVKDAVRLRKRSERDTTGLMLVEGSRELSCALDNAIEVLSVFLNTDNPGSSEATRLLERARQTGAGIYTCTENVFRKLAYRDSTESFVAVARQPSFSLQDMEIPANPLLIVAHSIEKPGNIGAILRSVDAAGASGLIVSDPLSDLANPNVIRASIGTVFSVRTAQAAAGDIAGFLAEKGIRTAIATPDTGAEYTSADLIGPLAIVIGSESGGIGTCWKDCTDLHLRIPMLGQADSLNASVSAALLLFEAVRQRKTHHPPEKPIVAAEPGKHA